ncbi:MAG: hypothetical protein CVT67_02140 [Actinobacteria bacterium HGW-Actinobacteria-7]|jgi:uncharacterized membrane protein|nr:MAG: hypothetical protein CVT67_02140 [Actinobacteria bacterium HGW-Actinobacteria-7]
MKKLIRSAVAVAAVMLSLSLAVPAWADSVRPAITVQAGSSASLTFQLTNDTSVEHSYELTTTGLPGRATATFAETGPVVTAIKVGAGKTAQVNMRVQVLPEAALAISEVTFVTRRDDGAVVRTPFGLEVQSTYALRITSASKSVSTFSGQDFKLDMVVANAGAAAVTNVLPKLEMPPKWVLVSDPQFVPNLDPGKEAVFHLTITVPASQVAIDQPVSVGVAGDQTASPASPVTVRVQNNPVYLPVAGGVVIIALGAVVIYFRRKGRR